jgi:hypothetical protein
LLNDHIGLTEEIVIGMDALPTFVERRPATKRQQSALSKASQGAARFASGAIESKLSGWNDA